MRPREAHHKITHGVKNRILAWAADRHEDGFTDKEAAYFTGVFHVNEVVALLERDGHRFTRVNEPVGNTNATTIRYYLVRR
jgi:hypothetical protein